MQRLVAAVICALNLGKVPSRINNHALFLEVKRRPDHETLVVPADLRFEPHAGFILTDEEYKEMLGEFLFFSAEQI
jgi:hypothetical protein